ncbi:hypothetical protein B0H14DRAFT_3471991 [Mycena olivaceomarginata]|nr:hypothetical protein B0H14DRAFT_3471991 [Mycena olivaceomarginata]
MSSARCVEDVTGRRAGGQVQAECRSYSSFSSADNLGVRHIFRVSFEAMGCFIAPLHAPS